MLIEKDKAKMVEKFQLAKANSEKFRAIFKGDIFKYYNPLMGFDLIKFEGDYFSKEIQDADSLKNNIIKQYGNDAMVLIQSLI